MEPKFSPPSKGGISGLKVVFFFPLLPLGAIFGGVVDFFLCKRGGEAGKEGFSANEKKAWRKIWCGFFFECGCNGHGAFGSWMMTMSADFSAVWRQECMAYIFRLQLCCKILILNVRVSDI